MKEQTHFERARSLGETYTSLALDPEELLRSIIPSSVDLKDAVAELKLFEQVWHSCYPGMAAYNLAHPVFNRKGDLLFELRPQTSPTAVGTGDSSPTSKFKSKREHRIRGPVRPGRKYLRTGIFSKGS